MRGARWLAGTATLAVAGCGSSTTAARPTPSASPSPSPPRSAALADFYMIDASRGMAIEDNVPGSVDVTSDGGRTWTRTAFPADVVPSQFYENVAGHAWAYRRDGRSIRLYRSANAGLSWAATVAMDGGSESTDPLFIDNLHGWLGISDCAGADLLVTHDGGGRWSPQALLPMPSAPAAGARYITHPPLFSDKTHGSLVVSAGGLAAIYLSSNGGHQLGPAPAAGDSSADRLHQGPHFWMVAGRSGATSGPEVGFYDSADGGVTWREVASTLGFEAHTIQFEGADHGWALGSAQVNGTATLMFTADAGRSWTDLHPVLP